jgi:hypothetical protein
MIWRRLRDARAAPPQTAHSPTFHFNLTLVWPAGAAARTEPIRSLQTRTREMFRVGRDRRAPEASRLVTLVERLWLQPDRGSPAGTIAPAMNPVRPTLRPPPMRGQRDAGDASPPQAQEPAPALAQAEPAPRLWPRARIAAQPAPAGNAVLIRREWRAPMTRLRKELQTKNPAAGEDGRGAIAEAPPPRAPVAMTLRSAAARMGSPAAGRSVTSRARAALVWRSEGRDDAFPATPGYAQARGPSRTDLVWRRSAPGPARDEAGASHYASASASASAAWRGDGEVRADLPAPPVRSSPAAAAPAAIQPAEMSRLVDEVVRRLDRIGRDERLRRGI